MIKVTFKDGKELEFASGIKIIDVIQSISPSLKKKSIYAIVNGEDKDLSDSLDCNVSLEIVTIEDLRSFAVLNHSSSHLLAHAVKRLYPNALFGIGPSIEEGFYYDFDFGDVVLTDADLPKIEKVMMQIVNENIEITHKLISKKEAKALYQNDMFKIDLIDAIESEEVSLYTQGDFNDVCRGVHVSRTGQIKHFKLLSLAGAYFRGDSNNKQLTRIYGTSWFSADELKKHLDNLEERKKRDHRRLGKELDLFMISDFGPGFPFWLPKGMALRNALQNYWYDIHTRHQYQFVQTPIMLNKELWEVSGHWYNYRDNMYTSEIDKHEFAIKPMNCPGGILVYKHSMHSYKDFPLRIGELGLVHRHEASGALTGLFRVRNFTQDDAHIFMMEEQIREEIASVILLYKEVYNVFNLKFHIELSTRPEEKYIGDIETWDKAENALADACTKAGFEYIINPGDGAFYGPKLDFKLKDSLNRIWQCGTIQLDMNLPERFDLSYISETGEKKRPVMVHRALFGSLERFIGVIIEHYAGAFPTWLAPVQVKVIPVNDVHKEYCESLNHLFFDNKIRFESDYRDEKLGYKIRESQTKKIPYTLVIGDEEVSNHTVTYRRYGKQESTTVSVNEFIQLINDHVKNLN